MHVAEIVSCLYSHHRAGVAALLAAFSDEKRSVRLPVEQLLCLRSVQVPDEPALLIIVRQVLVLLAHKVTSAPTRTVTEEIHDEQTGSQRKKHTQHISVLWKKRQLLCAHKHECSYCVNLIFLIFHHGFGKGMEEKLRDSLISVVVLDSQPVVNSFLTNSFVVEPARERARERERDMSRTRTQFKGFFHLRHCLWCSEQA